MKGDAPNHFRSRIKHRIKNRIMNRIPGSCHCRYAQ